MELQLLLHAGVAVVMWFLLIHNGQLHRRAWAYCANEKEKSVSLEWQSLDSHSNVLDIM